jgi:hypothetical protein
MVKEIVGVKDIIAVFLIVGFISFTTCFITRVKAIVFVIFFTTVFFKMEEGNIERLGVNDITAFDFIIFSFLFYDKETVIFVEACSINQ